VKVRAYRKGDGAEFVALVGALAKFEKLKPPRRAAAKRLTREIGRRIRVFILEEKGRAVGYVIYCFIYSSFLARPTLFLEDIFVLPEARRRGGGGMLMRRVMAEARRNKCGRAEWIVLGWNRKAQGFYRRFGARPLAGWTPWRMKV